jgi:DNA-binding transcriptional LysR family regulator
MQGLTFKQREALKAVARHRSVTAAAGAGAVGTPPSAMTRRLKELDAPWGLQLYDSTAQGLHVNRAGTVLFGDGAPDLRGDRHGAGRAF